MEDTGVVVIGGGSSGCFAALKLAQKDVDVTLYEEHPEIGIPSHCAGHLSIRGLQSLGIYPLPEEIVENTFKGATFYSPNCAQFSVRFEAPVTCTVNRALFDKYLSERAQNTGARVQLNSKVEKLTFHENGVQVRVKNQDKIETKTAKMVIDAEGISSRLARETGLPVLERRMIVNGVEAEVENIEGVRLDSVEVYFGSKYAPGFYAWLIPKKEGKAKIGLAAKNGHPKMLLEKLISRHPVASEKLRNAKIVNIAVHPITLGGPTSTPYSKRFLAVGDCASQVKSTTGGGVILGMTCAAIAAQIASEAIEKMNFSEFPCRYAKRLRQAIGFDARTMVRIRKTLDAMSDEKLDRLIYMCSRLGLEKTLRNVKDIDFQGRTLLHTLRSPRMLAALGYFLLTYLVGNP
jgi:digeranylgeranylglycerophospholipid reductase